MSITGQKEMPLPYFPSVRLSPAGVAEVSYVLYAQVDFPDAALPFTFIFSHCCVFAAGPPLLGPLGAGSGAKKLSGHPV